MKPTNRKSMRRVIVKQGYLKKVPAFGALLRKPERRWFVFGVIDNRDPYLEYYNSEDHVFNNTPVKTVFLSNCISVKHDSKMAPRIQNVFTIALKDRRISLVAPTREVMAEWCYALEHKLKDLYILNNGDGTNDYVDIPNVTRPARRALSQKESSKEESDYDDCMGPVQPLATRAKFRRTVAAIRHASPAPVELEASHTAAGADKSEDDYENLWSKEVVNEYEQPLSHAAVCKTPLEVSRPQHQSNILVPTPEVLNDIPVDPAPPVPSCPPFRSHIASAFQQYTLPNECSVPPRPTSLSSPLPDIAACSTPSVPFEDGAPPPYTPRSILLKGAFISLKQREVDELTKQQNSASGVKVIMTRSDCYQHIVFLDAFNSVWVAGWNHDANPNLVRAFHVGDQLISLNGQAMSSSHQVSKIIKQHKHTAQMEFTLKRIPSGRAVLLRRANEGDSLGMTCVDGTAEIGLVDSAGPAFQAGLPVQCPTVDGAECNWYITEVNNRPLSIFATPNQITHRLTAVGREITLVVQPSDLIKCLKKDLKHTKNYKSFSCVPNK